MRCGACGVEMLVGKRFCHLCGAPAPTSCLHCGAGLGFGFRFCPDCGTPVGSRPVLPAGERAGVERRQVTVCFCDLVGSTAIAARLDPEEYRELLEEYADTVSPEIVRRGGVVNQMAGDGLMALFGAPVAREDAPQRAVMAALGIVAALGPLAARMRARHGVEIAVRLGMHTGPVVVGAVGADRTMEYTAIGDTTNIAARLQTLAQPGQILISEATWRLVRGRVDATPLGPLPIRGKDAPVTAYAVHGWHWGTLASRVGAGTGRLTPFVGRAIEMEKLEAAFARARRGEAQVVSVVGEAGSGKSRLLYELRTRLEQRHTPVFEGRCAATLQSLPYHLFMAMFARWFGLDNRDSPSAAAAKVAARFDAPYDELERRYPVLCRFLSLPIERLGEQPAGELQRETTDAVLRLVSEASAKSPAVVMLEDLHWIDDPSRELLEDLVRRLSGARVLLVVTHRPERALAWHVPVALTQVVLGGLGREEIRTILRAVAGGRLPYVLEERLVQRSSGSPFFAEELVRGLLDEGHLARGDDGTLRLGPALEALQIPATVQEVLGTRLDTLSPAGKRTIQVAAVVGRQFSRRLVESLVAGEHIDVERELAELERRGLIHRKNLLTSDEWRFGESLTQEVAYGTLLLRQRRRLHARIAAELEAESDGRTAEHAAVVAHHWASSDERGKAIAALLRAARQAEDVPSYRTAGELYHRAWMLSESLIAEQGPKDWQRAALQAIEGVCRLTAYYGALDHGEAERAAVRGCELAALVGDLEMLAWLTGARGTFLITRPLPDFPGGLALLEESLARAEAADSPLLGWRLTRALCAHYVSDGRIAEAREHLQRLRAALEAAGHAQALSDLYLSTRAIEALVRYAEDDLDGAIASAADALELTRSAGNRTIPSAVASVRAAASLLRGDHAEARHWADVAMELGEAIANANVMAAGGSIGLLARQALGEAFDPARLLERIERGVATAGLVHLNLRFVPQALLAAGEIERADELSAALVAGSGGRLRDAYMLLGRAEVLAYLRRHEESLAAYTRARALAEAVGSRSVVAAALIGEAEVMPTRSEAVLGLERAAAICAALSLGGLAERLAIVRQKIS